MLADPDLRLRAAALQAIATLGPSAADAAGAVAPLLDNPDTQIDAADALGRIGAPARPALKQLAKLLASDQPAVRWAAVRAMSQIGGDDAKPVVEFMAHELPTASIVDGYNMMIYLALLGPVARDAIPAIERARVMQPALKPATLWAIQPDKSLPWMGGFGPGGGPGRGGRGFGGGPRGGDVMIMSPGPGGSGGPGGGPGGGGQGLDVVGSIYEAYVYELGDLLRPAVRPLAEKILDGSAGDVPAWGYKILARTRRRDRRPRPATGESRQGYPRTRRRLARPHGPGRRAGPIASACRHRQGPDRTRTAPAQVVPPRDHQPPWRPARGCIE